MRKHFYRVNYTKKNHDILEELADFYKSYTLVT